jgi:hypothetical protein
MQDLAGRPGPVAEADLRQIAAQEFDAARHVRARELRAVPLRNVGGAPQVTDVMEQRHDHAGDGALGAELPQRFDLPLVPGADARHGERHIERVLPVMVKRVDASVAGRAAGEHVVELRERVPQRLARNTGPGGRKQLFDGLQHRQSAN